MTNQSKPSRLEGFIGNTVYTAIALTIGAIGGFYFSKEEPFKPANSQEQRESQEKYNALEIESKSLKKTIEDAVAQAESGIWNEKYRDSQAEKQKTEKNIETYLKLKDLTPKEDYSAKDFQELLLKRAELEGRNDDPSLKKPNPEFEAYWNSTNKEQRKLAYDIYKNPLFKYSVPKEDWEKAEQRISEWLNDPEERANQEKYFREIPGLNPYNLTDSDKAWIYIKDATDNFKFSSSLTAP